MICLMIGGDHDGMYLDVDVRVGIIRMPVHKGPGTLCVQSPPTETVRHQEYRVIKLSDAGGVHFVLMHDVPNTGIIKALLDGYHKPRRHK